MIKSLAIAVVSLASLLSIGSYYQPVKSGFCSCAACDCSVCPGGADCCCDGACEFCGPGCVCE